MIKYKLFCKECDLKFDSWFASSKEYERLKKKKLLNCHNCNSAKVEKTTPKVNQEIKDTQAEINLKKKKGNFKLNFFLCQVVCS